MTVDLAKGAKRHDHALFEHLQTYADGTEYRGTCIHCMYLLAAAHQKVRLTVMGMLAYASTCTNSKLRSGRCYCIHHAVDAH